MKKPFKVIFITLGIACALYLFILSRMGPSGYATNFDYNEAAANRFTAYCNEHNIAPWYFGGPEIVTSGDRSKSYRWTFRKGPDSMEIVVIVPYQERLDPFQKNLPSDLKVAATPEAWRMLVEAGRLGKDAP